MWKGYHLSVKDIRKGYNFCLKWCIKGSGRGLDLGAELPRINLCCLPPQSYLLGMSFPLPLIGDVMCMGHNLLQQLLRIPHCVLGKKIYSTSCKYKHNKKLKTWKRRLLVQRCALRKFHVTDGQNTRDQITSDRRSKRAWSKCVLCIPYILSRSLNECWLHKAVLAKERGRQLTTAHANQTTGLTNGRAANWAPEVVFSPVRALFRLQLTLPSCCC